MKDGETMHTKLKKIGNSKGIIIPAGILKVFGLKEHDPLDIEVHNNELVIKKVKAFNPTSLEELFEGYHGDYQGEIVFDDVKGREVW